MVEVREGRLGKGVHAARRIERGEVILTGWGRTSPVRTRHSMQVDRDMHVTIDTPLQYINHSCEPNCGLLVRPEVRTVELHALRTIEAGEELTQDYAAFEDRIQFMTGPCLCQSAHCRGRVTGYHDLPAERRAALGPYVAPYLRESDAPATRAG